MYEHVSGRKRDIISSTAWGTYESENETTKLSYTEKQALGAGLFLAR
jgi:hypothetical protein